MKSWRPNRFSLLEIGGLVVFLVGFAVSMVMLERKSMTAELLFELRTPQNNVVKTYWRQQGERYSEEAATAFEVRPDQRIYRARLPIPADFQCLRLDPGNRPGMLSVSALDFQGSSIRTFDLLEPLRQGLARPNDQLEIDPAETTVKLWSFGSDPNLELCLDYQGQMQLGWAYFGIGLVMLVALFGLICNQKKIKGSPRQALLTIITGPGKVCGRQLLSESYRVGQVTRKQERGRKVVYQLELALAPGDDPTKVMQTARRDNPEAELHLQLGRAGEVGCG